MIIWVVCRFKFRAIKWRFSKLLSYHNIFLLKIQFQKKIDKFQTTPLLFPTNSAKVSTSNLKQISKSNLIFFIFPNANSQPLKFTEYTHSPKNALNNSLHTTQSKNSPSSLSYLFQTALTLSRDSCTHQTLQWKIQKELVWLLKFQLIFMFLFQFENLSWLKNRTHLFLIFSKGACWKLYWILYVIFHWHWHKWFMRRELWLRNWSCFLLWKFQCIFR